VAAGLRPAALAASACSGRTAQKAEAKGLGLLPPRE
jgi:hypothetical protein